MQLNVVVVLSGTFLYNLCEYIWPSNFWIATRRQNSWNEGSGGGVWGGGDYIAISVIL